MTLLDDRPTATEPSRPAEPMPRSTVSSWRFAARLARREVRRRPGRTLLAALLIAVPVAAMTTGGIVTRTNASDWAADFERDYGSADIVLGLDWISAADSGDVPRVPDGGTVIGSYVTATTSFTPADATPGEMYWARFDDIDYSNPAEAVGIEILDGGAPEPGEVLLSPDIADRFGVTVGDELALARPSGTWSVAGIGRLRGDYWQDLVSLPGFDLARIVAGQGGERLLVDMPADVPTDEITRLANERGGISRYQSPWGNDTRLATGMAWGFVAGVLALVAVGIIVAAAFATSARRQLVTIGQLSANGATERDVRRTLFLQGSWTGVIGAAIGVALGFAALPLAIPVIEDRLLAHELRALRLGAVDLVVIAATAIVAATVAAAVPARSASRVPVMAALAGRRPAGRPPRWLVPTGVVLFGGGLGLVAVAALGAQGANAGSNTWAALAVLGGTGMVFGMCCASPLVVERAGRLGRRAPLSIRMALRSFQRSRTRSASVVAAIAVTAGAAVAFGAVIEQAYRSNADCCPPLVPADTIVVHGYSPGYPEATFVDPGPLPPFDPPPALADYLARVDADVEPLLAATFDPAPFDTRVESVDTFGPWIATPALLDVMDLSAANLRLLEDVGAVGTYFDPATADYEIVENWEYRSEDGPLVLAAVPAVEPISFPLDSTTIVTEAAATEAGFETVEAGAIVRFDHPLTQAELQQVRDLQTSISGGWGDVFVEPGDDPRGEVVDPGISVQYDDPAWRTADDSDLWTARLVIVAVALLLSLLVVSIGLSLAAAEGREERNTFHVVGATPSTMRRQTATAAAVTAALGALMGVPLGFAPVWVVDRISDNPYETFDVNVSFPWLVVVAVLVVTPIVAAVGGWAGSGLAGRFRPPSPSRCD